MVKTIKGAREYLGKLECATFWLLPHFDVICYLLLNRRTASWKVPVLYNKETKNCL